LSKAGNSIESALYWFAAIREQTNALAQHMQETKAQRLAMM
jgi:dynein light intermediate chain 2, cytosolic